MEWKRSKEYKDIYYTSEVFNGCTYMVTVYVEDMFHKSIRFWFGASSGKKRKNLEVFEEKRDKSTGGIKALIWIKNSMLSFPEYYSHNEDKKQFICIQWSDNRRRNIYKRLEREGFYFMQIDGQKTLIKEVLTKY